MQTPINKETLRSHMTYHWWKYLLILVAAMFGWNLVYTVTAYRPPKEKIADVYVECFRDQGQAALDQWLAQVQETEMSDMEQMRSVMITNDAMYNNMQLSIFLSTDVGAIYMLTADSFQQCASNGLFIPLDEAEDVLAAAEEVGLDLQKGIRTESVSYEKHLFGIPLSGLPGLEKIGVRTEDTYMAINLNSGNEANLRKLMTIIIRTFAGNN